MRNTGHLESTPQPGLDNIMVEELGYFVIDTPDEANANADEDPESTPAGMFTRRKKPIAKAANYVE